MEQSPYLTHPQDARQARDFTAQQQAPSSLSFPNGAGHLTPPSEKVESSQSQQKTTVVNGQASNMTPAATPAAGGAGTGVSGRHSHG